MVYEGTLHEIGSGSIIQSSGNGVWRQDMWGNLHFRRYRVAQEGSMQRKFIQIGNTRIKNVVLRPEYDDELKAAVGQQVAISFKGHAAPSRNVFHIVAALRTPRGGTQRRGNVALVSGFLLGVPLFLVLGAFGGVFLAFVVALVAFLPVHFINDTYDGVISAGIGAAVGGALLLWLVFYPFVASFQMLRASNALGRRSDGEQAVYAP